MYKRRDVKLKKIIRQEQCCGSGIFISDPGSEFFHPGSRVQVQKDPGSGSASKNVSIFNPKQCFEYEI
jgi:hypothetical protein